MSAQAETSAKVLRGVSEKIGKAVAPPELTERAESSGADAPLLSAILHGTEVQLQRRPRRPRHQKLPAGASRQCRWRSQL
mmetsp:Transcript_3153/g.6074  ORF Transcript_3153/g.6074 Transcript_3153/m.6074 type:complete len:80 (-) Transcript_3153:9-248(-)